MKVVSEVLSWHRPGDTYAVRWPVSNGQAVDVSTFVDEALRDVPDGVSFRVTVETIEPETEPSQDPFIVSRPKAGSTERLVSERDGDRVVGTIQKDDRMGWLALNWHGSSLGSAGTMNEAAWMVWLVWDDGQRP